MDGSNVQQLSVDLDNIESSRLPSLHDDDNDDEVDDASSLAAQQLRSAFAASGVPSSLQSFSASLGAVESSSDHLRGALNGSELDPAFASPPRQGDELMSNLFAPRVPHGVPAGSSSRHRDHGVSVLGQNESRGHRIDERAPFVIAAATHANASLGDGIHHHHNHYRRHHEHQHQHLPPVSAPRFGLSLRASQADHGDGLDDRSNVFDLSLSPAQISEQGTGLPDPLGEDAPSKSGSYFKGLKVIANPPDLEFWREKLFNVDETITLSEEQYAVVVSTYSRSKGERKLAFHRAVINMLMRNICIAPFQIPDLFPPCRQRLFAPIYAKIQAQTVYFALLGLSAERPTTGDAQIQRPKQEKTQANRETTRSLRRQDQDNRIFTRHPWYLLGAVRHQQRLSKPRHPAVWRPSP